MELRVQSVAEVRKRYDAERVVKAFYPTLRFGDAGMTLGRGTVLAGDGAAGEDLAAGSLERTAVLLSTTYGRKVSPQALHFVSRARRWWREGDGVLAHIELAFARLPPLEARKTRSGCFSPPRCWRRAGLRNGSRANWGSTGIF